MSIATERTKTAEAEYKKKGMKRVKERIEEQEAVKLKNQKIQKSRASKALKRKIAKRHKEE